MFLLWEHEWITDTSVTLKKNDTLGALKKKKLKCFAHSSGDFCGSQHRRTSNHKFVNSGTKIEKFRKIVDHAIELSRDIVF